MYFSVALAAFSPSRLGGSSWYRSPTARVTLFSWKATPVGAAFTVSRHEDLTPLYASTHSVALPAATALTLPLIASMVATAGLSLRKL